MADGPPREFGRRAPAAVPPAAPVKRSGHVALLLMGTFAIGGGAYGLMPRENCGQRPGVASDAATDACSARGSSSGSHGSWSSSRGNYFFGGGSSSNQASGVSSETASGGVTRGGFGSFARAFAVHFSGS